MATRFNIIYSGSNRISNWHICDSYESREEAIKGLEKMAYGLYNSEAPDIILVTDLEEEIKEWREAGEVKYANRLKREMKKDFKPGFYVRHSNGDGMYEKMYHFGDDCMRYLDDDSWYIKEEDATPTIEQLEEKEIPYYRHDGQLGILIESCEFGFYGDAYDLNYNDFKCDENSNAFVPLTALTCSTIEHLLDGDFNAVCLDDVDFGSEIDL